MNRVGREFVAARLGNGNRLQALRERRAFRRAGRAQRFEHVGHIGKRVPDDARRFRHAVTPLPEPLGISDHAIQTTVLHPCGQALGTQA